MSDYLIERLNDNNEHKWEEFNKNSPQGSFFHSLKWKQLFENSSTVKTNYFLIFKNEKIVGICPFIEHKIAFFNGLIPMTGWGHYNAIIQDFNDPFVLQNVLKDFQKIKEKQKPISFICFSTLHKEIIDNLTDFPVYPCRHDGNIILDLQESQPEKIWDSFSAKKGERKFIKRFDKDLFSLKEVKTHDDLFLFYKYYKENINHLKGNLQSFSHFTDLWRMLLSNELRITLLSKNSTFAGGLCMITYKPKKTVYFLYLSLNRNLPNTYHPSYYLFWEGINWAWNNKYEKISFGAQNLDENNSRYRIKIDFGGKFEGIYSKMIPIEKLCSVGFKYKNIIKNLR